MRDKPTTLEILGRTWKVVWESKPTSSIKLDSGRLGGVCHPYNRLIAVDSTLPADLRREVLCHEVVHAALADSGQTHHFHNGTEEALADLLGSVFAHLMRFK